MYVYGHLLGHHANHKGALMLRVEVDMLEYMKIITSYIAKNQHSMPWTFISYVVRCFFM